MLDIKRLVKSKVLKYETDDPFKIAEKAGVVVIYEDLLDTMGYFNVYKQIKIIHINQALPRHEQIFTCSHELGHVFQHQGVNTPFLMRNTLFSVSKIEREANIFAVELLLPDDLLQEYPNISLYTLAAKRGIPSKLADLKQLPLLTRKDW